MLLSNIALTAKSMISDEGIFVKRPVTSYETLNMSLKSAPWMSLTKEKVSVAQNSEGDVGFE